MQILVITVIIKNDYNNDYYNNWNGDANIQHLTKIKKYLFHIYLDAVVQICPLGGAVIQQNRISS